MDHSQQLSLQVDGRRHDRGPSYASGALVRPAGAPSSGCRGVQKYPSSLDEGPPEARRPERLLKPEEQAAKDAAKDGLRIAIAMPGQRSRSTQRNPSSFTPPSHALPALPIPPLLSVPQRGRGRIPDLTDSPPFAFAFAFASPASSPSVRPMR